MDKNIYLQKSDLTLKTPTDILKSAARNQKSHQYQKSACDIEKLPDLEVEKSSSNIKTPYLDFKSTSLILKSPTKILKIWLS